MKIELIPVIEFGYHNQGIDLPEKYPYWDNAELWDSYNEKSYQKAGFKDKLSAYLPGSSFYRLTDIRDCNLTKLIKDHTQEMRNGDYTREQVSPFFGGYVLRIDGQDKYFPQCCGDLSDIQYWEKLLTEDKPYFYQGHPEPQVSCTKNTITFNFTVEGSDEQFVPPPPDIQLEIQKKELEKALQILKTELKIFSDRLIKINHHEQLKISAIDQLLIWGE